MKRDGHFGVNDWNGARRRNGYMLVELLLAAALSLIVLLTVIPLVTQAIRQDRIGAVREELARQGVGMDETMYHDLRYAQVTAVHDNQINFKTKDGNLSGFRVRGSTLQRMLSNQTWQPLTGAHRMMLGKSWVDIKPDGTEPYFKRVGDTIYITMILEDYVTKAQWSCRIVVVPWVGEEGQHAPT